jgi:DNA mismatch repair ATPase MutS
MRLDKQTLKDLEIFNSNEEKSGIFNFVDKTKTTGGRFCLKEMFLHPPEGLINVKQQQKAIQYFLKNINISELPFSEHQMKSLENYLSINITPIRHKNIFESIKFCFTDIYSYIYIKNSLTEITNFIKGFYSFLTNSKFQLPEILNNARKELEYIINSQEFKKIINISFNHFFVFHKILIADNIIRKKIKPNIENAIKWYYKFDALISMAKTTKDNNLVFPEFIENNVTLFSAEKLYHPLLLNAVPCNIIIETKSNFIFLTGPNMSGKTTFLKTIGAAILMSHLGMGIPAANAQLAYFDRLFTSININDDIFKGYSFFLSEVKRVKELAILLNNKERIFCLLDEPFKGTNVKDACDALTLVISGLVLWQKSCFILSSHLSEIWENISVFSNIKPQYFESNIVDEKPVFSYKLLYGISNLRLGLKIIENEKIMELLKKDDTN